METVWFGFVLFVNIKVKTITKFWWVTAKEWNSKTFFQPQNIPYTVLFHYIKFLNF